MCMSLVACGGTSDTPSEATESSAPKSSVPKFDGRQEIINICCESSSCKQLKGFNIGNYQEDDVYENGKSGKKVIAQGSYYPVDNYGEMGDKMLFHVCFYAFWNESTGKYDIRIDNDYIRPKY